ncbi:MAG: glycosyltransferase [Terriglobales bacterium]|jgi:glycosyltransferase involved in cell wall biosynthesis
MTSGTNLSPVNDFLGTGSVNPAPDTPSLHVLTLTPFFPFAANPVYGCYVSEPMQHFSEFGLRSTVIGVSALHRPRRRPLPGAQEEWLRYPQLPGRMGLSTAGRFLYRRVLHHVRRLHQRCPIDIIHAHSALPCGHAAAALQESLGVPFVVTIHGLDAFNACDMPETRAAKWRAKISAEVYRRARFVICVSSAIQSLLKDGMQQPVSSQVIYNGADPGMFFPEELLTYALPRLLMVGNLLRSKGHEIVLRAMAQVAERFPDLQCKVIGEGPDRQLFGDLAGELGISERVAFVGRQDRQSVADAMRECTIFALPSRSEGLGCVYLEAMACGKPVIACEGQGIGEIIQHGHNGWLIPVDSVRAMAGALSRLLDSPDLRTSIGANARQTIVNGLTIMDQVRRLNDVYRNVVRLQAR